MEINLYPVVSLTKEPIAGFGLVPVFEGEGLERDILTRPAKKTFATGAAWIRISPSGDIPNSLLKLFQHLGFRGISR